MASSSSSSSAAELLQYYLTDYLSTMMDEFDKSTKTEENWLRGLKNMKAWTQVVLENEIKLLQSMSDNDFLDLFATIAPRRDVSVKKFLHLFLITAAKHSDVRSRRFLSCDQKNKTDLVKSFIRVAMHKSTKNEIMPSDSFSVVLENKHNTQTKSSGGHDASASVVSLKGGERTAASRAADRTSATRADRTSATRADRTSATRADRTSVSARADDRTATIKKKKKKGDIKLRSSMTQILNNTKLKNKKMKSFDATGYSITGLQDADPTFIDPSIVIN